MKSIPAILAGLVATLLILCAVEYGFRGLNPDVESDWVVHPAWWQSDSLADVGFYLRAYAVLASSPFQRFLGGNFYAFLILFFSLQLLIIAGLSLIVFCIASLPSYLAGLTARSREYPLRSDR